MRTFLFALFSSHYRLQAPIELKFPPKLSKPIALARASQLECGLDTAEPVRELGCSSTTYLLGSWDGTEAKTINNCWTATATTTVASNRPFNPTPTYSPISTHWLSQCRVVGSVVVESCTILLQLIRQFSSIRKIIIIIDKGAASDFYILTNEAAGRSSVYGERIGVKYDLFAY